MERRGGEGSGDQDPASASMPKWVEKAEQLVEKTRESLNGHAAGDLFYHENRHTAHDWMAETEAKKTLFDDGTTSFFW
jgi:hypothetical protein